MSLGNLIVVSNIDGDQTLGNVVLTLCTQSNFSLRFSFSKLIDCTDFVYANINIRNYVKFFEPNHKFSYQTQLKSIEPFNYIILNLPVWLDLVNLVKNFKWNYFRQKKNEEKSLRSNWLRIVISPYKNKTATLFRESYNH